MSRTERVWRGRYEDIFKSLEQVRCATSTMLTRRSLLKFAIAISIFSVLYNGAEGVVSILFGVDSSSHALVFFGIQSGIEVFSAVLVTWRFARSISDEDTSDATPPDIVR